MASSLKMNLPRNTTLYNLGKTTTYRAASSGLFVNKRAGFDGWGTNLQNIEKSARAIYYADDGKLLSQRDQSGAEALIVAKLAPRGNFNDLFTYGIKPHVYVALHNFLSVWRIKCKTLDLDRFVHSPIKDLPGIPGWSELKDLIASSDEWKSSERYYYIAKMMCHSGNYGIGTNEFRENTLEKSRGTVILSRAEAEEYLRNYHSLFPEIHKWHAEVERQIKQTRYLFNLFGHPWYYSGNLNMPLGKDVFAFVPQSTVGVITHIAITKMQEYIEQNDRDWDILQNNHDSFLVQHPTNEWEECQYKMKEFINMKLKAPNGEEFSMKSEGQVGRNWAPYKAGKNEDGLRTVKI